MRMRFVTDDLEFALLGGGRGVLSREPITEKAVADLLAYDRVTNVIRDGKTEEAVRQRFPNLPSRCDSSRLPQPQDDIVFVSKRGTNPIGSVLLEYIFFGIHPAVSWEERVDAHRSTSELRLLTIRPDFPRCVEDIACSAASIGGHLSPAYRAVAEPVLEAMCTVWDAEAGSHLHSSEVASNS